jgi:hypothetical protein
LRRQSSTSSRCSCSEAPRGNRPCAPNAPVRPKPPATASAPDRWLRRDRPSKPPRRPLRPQRFHCPPRPSRRGCRRCAAREWPCPWVDQTGPYHAYQTGSSDRTDPTPHRTAPMSPPNTDQDATPCRVPRQGQALRLRLPGKRSEHHRLPHTESAAGAQPRTNYPVRTLLRQVGDGWGATDWPCENSEPRPRLPRQMLGVRLEKARLGQCSRTIPERPVSLKLRDRHSPRAKRLLTFSHRLRARLTTGRNRRASRSSSSVSAA